MATVIGRYALHGLIAQGGMAAVHLGRLAGPAGFSRTVAIKRLHPTYAKDPHFVEMFLDEARLAARVQHPNVVHVIDVVSTDGELFLVMEYIKGESFARVLRHAQLKNERVPMRIVLAVVHDLLEGLHAAHEARDEEGKPLNIVHRDVSPQNVLVGLDGVARVLDFGIAKASGRAQHTTEGQLKGKLSYMAPEQLHGQVTRRTDVFAASIVLWEALTGRRLFAAENEGQVVTNILLGSIEAPSKHAPDVPPELDAIVLQGLSREPEARYATARDMVTALSAIPRADAPEVAQWLEEVAADLIKQRTDKASEAEAQPSTLTFAATEITKRLTVRPKRWPIALAMTGTLVAGAAGAALFFATRTNHTTVAPAIATSPTQSSVTLPTTETPSAASAPASAPAPSASPTITARPTAVVKPITTTTPNPPPTASDAGHGALIVTSPY